jgi:hypothetical protein
LRWTRTLCEGITNGVRLIASFACHDILAFIPPRSKFEDNLQFETHWSAKGYV